LIQYLKVLFSCHGSQVLTQFVGLVTFSSQSR
jgi:hypothetical protein